MPENYYTKTRVDLRLDPDYDVSLADELFIAYKAPNGQKGSWPATLFQNCIRYVASPTDIQVKGTWQFNAGARFGTEYKIGDTVYKTFIDNLY